MKKFIKCFTMILAFAAFSAMMAACGDKPDTRTELAAPVNIRVEAAATSITFFNNDNLSAGEILEVSVDGENWQEETTITGLRPNTVYTAYARYKETEIYKASPSFTQSVTTLKHTQSLPAVGLTQADKTITIDPDPALEYSFDDGVTWSDENTHTYSENGEKNVKVRYRETNERYPSEEQTLKVVISDFYAGSGSEEDPFQIVTPAHFLALKARRQETYYRLMNNLDLGGTPITAPAGLYRDVFDGNGFTLSNARITPLGAVSDGDHPEIGVFGSIGSVKNLSVENAKIEYTYPDANSVHYFGLLAGRAQEIVDCSVSGEILLTDGRASGFNSYIGGVAGEVNEISIRPAYLAAGVEADVKITCDSPANCTARRYVGGMFGQVESLSGQTFRLTKSSVAAVIELTKNQNTYVGGLAGALVSDVENCFATGSITTDGAGGNAAIGGLAALFCGNIDGCYAAVNIGANGNSQNVLAGGIAATVSGTTEQRIENCFFAGNLSVTDGGGKTVMSDAFACGTLPSLYTVSNCYHSDNLTDPVSTQKTTAAAEATMRSAAWQSGTLRLSGDVWRFSDGAYPVLK